MKKFFLFVATWLSCFLLWGQEAELSMAEDLTEMLAENSEEELNMEELTETWEYFLENPININGDCADQLRQLRILTELQVQGIVDYKNGNGPVLSIYELVAVNGTDRALLQKLAPFLTFGKSESSGTTLPASRGELLFRTQRTIEKAKGYTTENGYRGAPEKYYLRFKQSGGHLNYGITAEKDPGETFFRAPNQHGFDYYSLFANYGFKNGKHRIYLGDYMVRTGQGLIAWQGFGSGKSAEVTRIYQGTQGLCSYTSADENRFFRGIAGEFTFKNSILFFFHSEKKIDANIEMHNGETVFTSFQTSGLHRTSNESADKHSVKENANGLIFLFRKNNFSAGFSAIHTFFDKPRIPGNEAYQLFSFRGKQIINAATDYKWSLKKLFLFGETAYSSSGGFANLHGILLKPASQLELSLLYRNFGQKYHSLYGQAFSESSAINDEQGFYAGAVFLPMAKISIAAYHDFFRYRWLKYQTASPSTGTETFFQLNYIPSSAINFYMRYFIEQKEKKTSEGQLEINETNTLQKFRLNLDIQVNDQWSLKSRAEFSGFKTEKGNAENGMLLLQDIKYKAVRVPFSCQLRLLWFDTEGYNARLYAYENDLLHSYSIPVLSGKGVRAYLNARIGILKQTDLWLKLARTQYLDQQTTGSGPDQIKGDKKTEIKFQIRFRF
ncbi:MAG: helix-hairpin-helix domain-containing protein [Prolixibacteraceae bacterium]|nr:helix-hairpin-helix domain-containing protein [Prolixibacteraceae bacterium]